MRDSTKVFLLLGLLLLLIFPFAGLAPLMILLLAGLLGMILQLVSSMLMGSAATSNDRLGD
ncbi:MAG: hypothetical protein AAGF01_19220 [Cyanobacteria bacterium P01_G01_bin.38]